MGCLAVLGDPWFLRAKVSGAACWGSWFLHADVCGDKVGRDLCASAQELKTLHFLDNCVLPALCTSTPVHMKLDSSLTASTIWRRSCSLGSFLIYLLPNLNNIRCHIHLKLSRAVLVSFSSIVKEEGNLSRHQLIGIIVLCVKSLSFS